MTRANSALIRLTAVCMGVAFIAGDPDSGWTITIIGFVCAVVVWIDAIQKIIEEE